MEGVRVRSHAGCLVSTKGPRFDGYAPPSPQKTRQALQEYSSHHRGNLDERAIHNPCGGSYHSRYGRHVKNKRFIRWIL